MQYITKLWKERRGTLENGVSNAAPFESFSLHDGKFLTYRFRSYPHTLHLHSFHRNRELKLREKRESVLCTVAPNAGIEFLSFEKYIKYFIRIAHPTSEEYNVDLTRWFIYVKRVDYVKHRYFPIYKKENYGFQNSETLCRLKLRKKINVHVVLSADP